MFIIQNRFIIALLVLVISAASAYAESKKDDSVKEFLEGRELAIERKQVNYNVVGQKGLIFKKETDSIAELIDSNLVNPFNNKIVSNAIDLNYFESHSEYELENEDVDNADVIMFFRDEVDAALGSVEQQTKVDELDLLNRLVIDRIMTSPDKYVVIQNKKYYKQDEIEVEFIKNSSFESFKQSLDDIDVSEATSEEKIAIEDIKQEAMDRYNEDFRSSQAIKRTIKIENIESRSIKLSVNEKTYLIKMKK
ncbi:MAG: hypothetical protein GY793_06015 [Proteobacteria bacterium]|nr:hypothetical protein [Pseudomonadota bacterium]